ncbi:MAG TPA: trypsin-like peptidase domain-containing protein [Kofleriaceae bacterium]|nr:trypsin-like peptidase domain-containing protein [Kofleriaceae bacterium]
MKPHRYLIAAFAAFGLLGAGVALNVGSSPVHAAPPAGMPTDGTIADVAERVVDSVVNISVTGTQKTSMMDPSEIFGSDPFGGGEPQGREMAAKGSGVIVTAGGRILTNAHVVDGFDNIKVTLPDGTEMDAKVVGKDTKADLAVIQLKGAVPPLKPITFGDSSQLRLGDIVLAVGDGLGVGKSVSMGIVSAKGRGGLGIEQYEDFIQTDAAINPGNSGGALVNLKGELVGINTAIASRTGGYSGIGFAIPTSMARPIMDMLVKDGKVTRGYLGVHIATVTPTIAKQQKLGANAGVEVADVEPDGPAAKAHLSSGDVIVSLDGQPIKNSVLLQNTIALTPPGTTVAFGVVHRDGTRATVKARLGQLRDEQPQQEQSEEGLPQLPQGQGWNCKRTENGMECQQTRRWP